MGRSRGGLAWFMHPPCLRRRSIRRTPRKERREDCPLGPAPFVVRGETNRAKEEDREVRTADLRRPELVGGPERAGKRGHLWRVLRRRRDPGHRGRRAAEPGGERDDGAGQERGG